MDQIRDALRRSLAPLIALASISWSLAGECIPDLSHYTPTPTISWSQSDLTYTAGFRVDWKRAEDVQWRGSIDLPVWPGDATSDPVYPGITEPFPLQRLVPTTEQRLLIDVRVASYDATHKLGVPSNILRLCMPEIWTGGPYR